MDNEGEVWGIDRSRRNGKRLRLGDSGGSGRVWDLPRRRDHHPLTKQGPTRPQEGRTQDPDRRIGGGHGSPNFSGGCRKNSVRPTSRVQRPPFISGWVTGWKDGLEGSDNKKGLGSQRGGVIYLTTEGGWGRTGDPEIKIGWSF